MRFMKKTKINRDEAVSILKEYINSVLIKKEWYKNIEPYIKAVVFYGSTAKGLNRADSDLDLLIFVPLKTEKKFTKGEYLYKYYGRKINIVIRSVERLRKLGLEQNNKFETEIFKNSEVLSEKDSEVRLLIKRLKK